MPSRLIDDKGQSWKAGDPALGKHLGTRLTGKALAEFTIRNMGWIGVDQSQRSLRIKCRPAFVAEAALVELLFLIHDQPEKSLALELLGDRSQHFVLRDRATFTRFLASLVSGPTNSGWPGARLLRVSRAERNSPFRRSAPIAQGLATSARAISDAVLPFQTLFRGRWSLYTLDGEMGHTKIHEIGNAYTPFNPRWLSTAKGQSLCGYADEAYGIWIAQRHRYALRRGRILFDDVDAVVSFPHVGSTRLRYSRATIPILRPDGQAFVLSAAVSDDSIDFRKPSRHEIN